MLSGPLIPGTIPVAYYLASQLESYIDTAVETEK